LTDALFAALAAENDELRMERTAKGDLEIMVPAGGEGSNKNLELTTQLGVWARTEGRGLGVAFDSSGGFVLPSGAILSPDASWVALPRWEALTAEERKTFPPLCPDFVVELRSSTDKPSNLRKKMEQYMAAGARLGWLIDPLSGTVEIYRPRRGVEKLERPETLSGEDVLPGFVLDCREILAGP
jgi:Uma2 family endonuclease